MLNDILSIGFPRGWEWIVILAIVVLIFGGQIPKIARNITQAIIEIRRGAKEITDAKEEIKKDIKDAMK